MSTLFRIAKLVFSLLAPIMGFAACDSTPRYHKKDGQWFFESRTLGVSASLPLTLLNPYFARVGGQIFYCHDAIDSADSASFVALDDRYGKDKSRLLC